ncbi:MAG: 3-dehydroquinate synthase [Candidatus Omnitrophota bacterium]
MKIITVNLKERSYNIVICNNMLKSLCGYIQQLNIGESAYIITNNTIKNIYGNILDKILSRSRFNLKFKTIPDSEKSKSLKMVFSIIEDLAEYSKNKRVFIIAFGGGVIGDIAGFTASIYKRGIPYIQIPTTLLAQIDSSIGGKTAVDLKQGKNLVGAFYQPELVYSDINFLNSLNLKQIKSGLSEVIKYALIKDPLMFKYIEKNYPAILAKNNNALEFIISRSCKIKAGIVQRDEKEKKGIRTILNFGHTIGHAIETAGGYKRYNHGEAIAIGMLAASEISLILGLINNSLLRRIEELIQKTGLPAKINNLSIEKIIEAHYLDKKFTGSENKFVLIEGVGKTRIEKNIPLKVIKEALKRRS